MLSGYPASSLFGGHKNHDMCYSHVNYGDCRQQCHINWVNILPYALGSGAIKLCSWVRPNVESRPQGWEFLHGSLGRLFGSFQSFDFSIQLLGGTTSKPDAVEVGAFDSRCQGSRSFFSAAFNLGNDSRKNTSRQLSTPAEVAGNPVNKSKRLFCKQFGLCLSCFCAVRELCHHLVFFFLLFCTCVVLE